MNPSRDLVLGIDCSTTACKAIIWDREGHPLAEGRAPLPLLMPRPTWHEQRAEDWWSAMVEAVGTAVSKVDTRRLAALCLTHQRETFVLVDDAGHPLRNAILWMDVRAGDLLPDLDRRYGNQRIHEITGKPLSGNLSLSKIFWLKENEPHLLPKAHKVIDVHAFLAHQLTGHYRTGWGSADPTGLFDMRHHTWANDLLALVGLRLDQMAETYPPGGVIGEVTPQAATLCGLPTHLPVIAGLGDGQSAGLGANITRPGLAYLNLGTAVVSGTYADRYIADRAFRTMCGGVPRSYLLETVILGGTYTVTWFVNQFADREMQGDHRSLEEAMEAACRALPAGALGLLLVPYWNSAMNPYWDAGASGIIVGWRGIHGRAHLYRAVLEGIAFEQRLHVAGVEAALGDAIEGFVAMGGGARSLLWCQIIADVTGKPVVRCTTAEAAALGAGILAASGAGLYSDVSRAAAAMCHNDAHAFVPDDRNHEIYTRLYEDVYRHLFPALQPYLQRLTELTAGRAAAS